MARGHKVVTLWLKAGPWSHLFASHVSGNGYVHNRVWQYESVLSFAMVSGCKGHHSRLVCLVISTFGMRNHSLWSVCAVVQKMAQCITASIKARFTPSAQASVWGTGLCLNILICMLLLFNFTIFRSCHLGWSPASIRVLQCRSSVVPQRLLWTTGL